MRTSALLLLATTLLCPACLTGGVAYTPPFDSGPVATTVTVPMTKEAVWAKLVPTLGGQYFGINVIDKESGIVSLTYAGDPEPVVDCGILTAHVKSLTAERQYTFPGARASIRYEAADQGSLFLLSRTLSLDGRVNLVVTETTPGTTEVSAKARYVLTRVVTVQAFVAPWWQSGTDRITFDSGEAATFPLLEQYPLTCRPKGALERNLLSIFRP